MSTLLYASLVLQEREKVSNTNSAAAAVADRDKLAESIAALFPAEVIALHSVVVGLTTSTTTTSGTTITTITHPGWLGLSLVLLGIAVVLLYALGSAGFVLKKPSSWRTAVLAILKWRREWIRAVIPLLAFLAWAGVIRPSALSPVAMWAGMDSFYVALAMGTLGVLLLAISQRPESPPVQGTELTNGGTS